MKEYSKSLEKETKYQIYQETLKIEVTKEVVEHQKEEYHPLQCQAQLIMMTISLIKMTKKTMKKTKTIKKVIINK